MHYTGMAAFEIAGVILWDSTLVVASILLGAAIGAVALPVGLHGSEEKWKIGGAVLLTLAICSHHFTAMGAVSIIPNPTIEISPSALPAGWLAVGVAVASFAIIGLALAGVVLDIRDRRRSETGSRPDARSRRCVRGGASGLRRRRDRLGQHQFRQPDRPVRFQSRRRQARNLFSGQGRTRQTAVRIEPDGRNPLAPSRRFDDARRVDPAADRVCRTAASCRSRSRSAGAQGGRTAHPLSRASRRADIASQPRPFQHPDRPGNSGPGRGRKPRRALPRSRPLQGGQRPVRTRRGRHRASDRGFARHRGARPATGDGAPGRRRVRHSDARRCKPGGGRPACRDHPGSAAHHKRRAGDQQHLDEHRHRGLSGRRDGSRDAAQPRRHRPLPGQERRPQHLSLLRGRDGRRGSRTPAART